MKHRDATMGDEDDCYDEWIWTGICQVAANRAAISVERARAILEDTGQHAYGHTGIVDARVEMVLWVTAHDRPEGQKVLNITAAAAN